MDFKVGDFVLYGTDGVCRISEVTEREIGGERYRYFILVPVYDEKSTIFLPLGNEKLLNRMRPVVSQGEFDSIAEEVAKSEYEWIESDSQRKEAFRLIIDESCTYDLLKLLKMVYTHREERLADGKKLHVVDERVMKEAEKILQDEVAYSFKISREEAMFRIVEKLGFSK